MEGEVDEISDEAASAGMGVAGRCCLPRHGQRGLLLARRRTGHGSPAARGRGTSDLPQLPYERSVRSLRPGLPAALRHLGRVHRDRASICGPTCCSAALSDRPRSRPRQGADGGGTVAFQCAATVAGHLLHELRGQACPAHRRCPGAEVHREPMAWHAGVGRVGPLGESGISPRVALRRWPRGRRWHRKRGSPQVRSLPPVVRAPVPRSDGRWP